MRQLETRTFPAQQSNRCRGCYYTSTDKPSNCKGQTRSEERLTVRIRQDLSVVAVNSGQWRGRHVASVDRIRGNGRRVGHRESRQIDNRT
jgi:hypothetical protein